MDLKKTWTRGFLVPFPPNCVFLPPYTVFTLNFSLTPVVKLVLFLLTWGRMTLIEIILGEKPELEILCKVEFNKAKCTFDLALALLNFLTHVLCEFLFQGVPEMEERTRGLGAAVTWANTS